jgi:tRNA dimethylallyltransferase
MQAGSSGLSKAVLIAGPTASGKSALALDLAQKAGGVVINADSMQVYRDLRIITARPTVEEEARVPHRLYGHVDAAINFSAGALVAEAAKVLEEARARHKLAIFVGGSTSISRRWQCRRFRPGYASVRARHKRDGVEALHAELARRDPFRRAPETARPHSHRACAGSIEATERALPEWHREGLPPLLPREIFRAVPAGARQTCADRCASCHAGVRRHRGVAGWPGGSSIRCCRP